MGRWGRNEGVEVGRLAVGMGTCEVLHRVVDPKRAITGAAIIIDRMGGGMIVIATRRMVADRNPERRSGRPAHDRAGGEQADQD